MKCEIIDVVNFYNQYPEYIGEIEVDTRHGYKTIEYADISAENSEVYETKFDNGCYIKTSPDHLLFCNNGWVKVKELQIGDFCETKFGFCKISSISIMDYTEDLYDLQVADVHEYYTNDIVSHNSSLLDAITFALFGKPFKRITKKQLINSINERDCYVEIIFDIGNNSYVVRRGIKPNIFEIECNGRLLDKQAAAKDDQKYLEDHILKLNYKSFTQIVILGSANFVPFMQLFPVDRRVVVEDILDIQIFSTMRDILRERNQVVRENYLNVENALALIDSKIEINEKHIQDVKEANEQGISELKELVKVEQDRVEEIAKQLDDNNALVDEESKKLIDIPTYHIKDNTYSEYATKIEQNMQKATKLYGMYRDKDECPVCTQELTEEFRKDKQTSCNLEIHQYRDALQQLQDKRDEIKSILNENAKVQGKINEMQKVSSSFIQQINTANSVMQTHLKRLNDYTDLSIDDHDLTKLHAEKKKLYDEKTKLSETKYYNQIIGNLLNDSGIKTKVIKQYLPIINKRVNAYLVDMDSYINFELDETFNERIESRYRDGFSYSSFSEGEKKRIDIALLLTWRDIASMKSSVDINLLFLDEIFDSSLDSSGVDDVMKLFDTLKNTNLFIVSHRGDILEDKFENKIRVNKIKKFTVMEQE